MVTIRRIQSNANDEGDERELRLPKSEAPAWDWPDLRRRRGVVGLAWVGQILGRHRMYAMKGENVFCSSVCRGELLEHTTFFSDEI